MFKRVFSGIGMITIYARHRVFTGTNFGYTVSSIIETDERCFANAHFYRAQASSRYYSGDSNPDDYLLDPT